MHFKINNSRNNLRFYPLITMKTFYPFCQGKQILSDLIILVQICSEFFVQIPSVLEAAWELAFLKFSLEKQSLKSSFLDITLALVVNLFILHFQYLIRYLTFYQGLIFGRTEFNNGNILKLITLIQNQQSELLRFYFKYLCHRMRKAWGYRFLSKFLLTFENDQRWSQPLNVHFSKNL
jgi:hypothetical protein